MKTKELRIPLAIGAYSSTTRSFTNLDNLYTVLTGGNLSYGIDHSLPLTKTDGTISRDDVLHFKQNKVKALTAKKNGDGELYSRYKLGSSIYLNQANKPRRKKLTKDGNSIIFDTLPFFIIDIDNFYGDEKLSIIEFYKKHPSTLFINHSSSGTGLHVYFAVEELTQITHEEFKYYYLSLAKDLTNQSGVFHVDTAMANSVQPSFFTPHNIYKNIEAVPYKFDEDTKKQINNKVPHINEYYTYLNSSEGLQLNKNTIVGDKDPIISFNKFVEYKKQSILNKSIVINRNKRGEVITQEYKELTEDDLLTNEEQNAALTRIFARRFNKTEFNKHIAATPNKTFFNELKYSMPLAVSFKNISNDNVLAFFLGYGGTSSYSNKVYSMYNDCINTIKKDKVYQKTYSTELNTNAVSTIIAGCKKNDVIVDNTTMLKKGDHIADTDYKPVNFDYIIADTKSGKSYFIIDRLRKLSDKEVKIIIVPTVLLRSEFINKYKLELYTSTCMIDNSKIYVGTYDAYIKRQNFTNGVIVVDEVHTIITENYRPVMSALYHEIKDKMNKFILMTATPITEFEGYREKRFRFNTVETSSIKFFVEPFKKYVVDNLDVNKNNLVYFNNVEKGLQYFYEHYKSKGFLCKLLISEKNESFLKQYRIDQNDENLKPICTYLTTKVIEVGIGIEENLDEVFINATYGDSMMSKEDLTQILNRDNRSNAVITKQRMIYFRIEKNNKRKTGDNFVRGNMKGVGYSLEYKREVSQYMDNVFKNYFDRCGIEYIYDNRYINDNTFENIINPTELKSVDLKRFKEEDFILAKQDEYKLADLVNALVLADDTCVKACVKACRKFVIDAEYQNYFNALRTVKINIEYDIFIKELNINKGRVNITYDELNIFITNIINTLLEDRDILNIDTPYNIKKDILFYLNTSVWKNKGTKLGYYIDGSKILPWNVVEFCWVVDHNYTKKEIKVLCLANSLNYQGELLKFKSKTVRGKRYLIIE